MRRASRPGNVAAFAATVLVLLTYISVAASQAVDPDKVNFSTMSEWKDLRECVKCELQDCLYNIAWHQGCATNACICRGSTLGEGIQKLGDNVLKRCSNLDDTSTAVSVLTAYCSSKGYTEVVQPTILQPTTGAYTVTVTAAAVTVIQTRVVNTAAGIALRSSDSVPPHLIATLAAVLAALASPFLCCAL